MTQGKTGLDLSQVLAFIDIRKWARQELSKPPPLFNSPERRELQKSLEIKEAGFSTAVRQYDAAVSILKLRFILAPIRLLPSDLFKYICDFLPQYVIPRDWRSLMNVTNVSHSWRNAILDNPRIWSDVRLGLDGRPLRPASVEHWLRQSKAHRLHLVLVGDSKICRLPAFEAAFPHFDRLETLTLVPDDLTCSPVRLRRMLSALSHASGLTSLTLSWHLAGRVTLDDESRKVIESQTMILGRLEELNLVRWPMRTLPQIAAPNLRVLRIGDVKHPRRVRLFHSSMHALADAYSTITELVLSYESPGRYYGIRYGIPTIVFPHLKKFVVAHDEDLCDNMPFYSIHGGILRGSTSITHLEVISSRCQNLPRSPSVTHYHLRVSSGTDRNLPEDIFEQLPSLSEFLITLERPRDGEDSAEVMAYFMDDRVSGIFTTLKDETLPEKTAALCHIAIDWEDSPANTAVAGSTERRMIFQALLHFLKHRMRLKPSDQDKVAPKPCLISLRNASPHIPTLDHVSYEDLMLAFVTASIEPLDLE